MTEGHSSAHAEATSISAANSIGSKVTTLSAMSAAAGSAAVVDGVGAIALEALVSSTMATAGSTAAIPASASSSASNMVLQQPPQLHPLQAHHQNQNSGAGVGKAAACSSSAVVLSTQTVQPSAAVPMPIPVQMPNGPTSTFMTSITPGAEALVASAGGPMPMCPVPTSEPLQISDVEKVVATHGWPRAVDALFSADHDPRLSPLIGKRIDTNIVQVPCSV